MTFSDANDGKSLEYRSAVPALTLSLDAECKASSQVVSLPGPPRYMAFSSGLGKAETAVDFGPGGTIVKINSKTEGQTEDALKILSTVMGAAATTAAVDGGGKDATAAKCKPTVATYLINYDAAGRPSVDLNSPFFLKIFE